MGGSWWRDKVCLDMAADRGAFICQSQSLNIHMAEPTTGKLTSMHFYAWRKGLKTGMYYLRTRPKVRPICRHMCLLASFFRSLVSRHPPNAFRDGRPTSPSAFLFAVVPSMALNPDENMILPCSSSGSRFSLLGPGRRDSVHRGPNRSCEGAHQRQAGGQGGGGSILLLAFSHSKLTSKRSHQHSLSHTIARRPRHFPLT